jgi:hypothetical protein
VDSQISISPIFIVGCPSQNAQRPAGVFRCADPLVRDIDDCVVVDAVTSRIVKAVYSKSQFSREET